MSIEQISESQFLQQATGRQPMAGAIAKEMEWYASTNGIILGTLFQDNIDRDWGYAVLGPNSSNVIGAIDINHSITSQEEARSQLLASMSNFENSGRTSFD